MMGAGCEWGSGVEGERGAEACVERLKEKKVGEIRKT